MSGRPAFIWKDQSWARSGRYGVFRPWLWSCRVCNEETPYAHRSLEEAYGEVVSHLRRQHLVRMKI